MGLGQALKDATPKNILAIIKKAKIDLEKKAGFYYKEQYLIKKAARDLNKIVYEYRCNH